MTQTLLSKTYQIPPASVRRLLLRAIGNTVLSVLAGFFALWYAVREENDTASLRFSYGVTSFLVVAVGIPAFLRFKGRLKSLRLVLYEDAVLRRQEGSPDLLIKRNEISRVEERPRSGLTIRVKGQDTALRIPAEIAGYSEIRDQLASWIPIGSKFLGGIYLTLASLIVTTAVIGIFLRSQNFWIVFSASQIFLVCLALILMKTRGNHGADRVSRRLVWGLVLVTVLALVFKVVETFNLRR